MAEVWDWAVGLQEVRERIGPGFARTEPRENAVAYLRGLLSGAWASLGCGAEELVDAI